MYNGRELDLTETIRLSDIDFKKNTFTIELKGKNITTMSHMFTDCFNIIKIEGLNAWNTSKVTDMSGMFYNCHELILVINSSKLNSIANKDMIFKGIGY